MAARAQQGADGHFRAWGGTGCRGMTQSPLALRYSTSIVPWETSPLQHPEVVFPKLTRSCKTGLILGMLGSTLAV